MQQAQLQLELRIRLVDYVMTFGFDKSCTYTGHIYVPVLLQTTKPETCRQLSLSRILTVEDPESISTHDIISKTARGDKMEYKVRVMQDVQYLLYGEEMSGWQFTDT